MTEKKRILVVDDDPVYRITAGKVLEQYEVITREDGPSALAFLREQGCDLILLDINMPEMDGFAVFAALRKLPGCSEIPVMILTSDDDAETETKCLELGAIDFIAKPFVSSVMLSRVARILELEELRRRLAANLEKKTQEVSDIRDKSTIDELTGLRNRHYLEEVVRTHLGSGDPGTLMMFDLDNFKAINDTYGHGAGDQTLRTLAGILRKFFREEDVLCRLGGDEFVVYVSNAVSRIDIENRAAAVITELIRSLKEYGFETNSSVSIGIAQAPDDADTFEALYAAADQALYRIKLSGKNDYCFYGDCPETGDQSQDVVTASYLDALLLRESVEGLLHPDFNHFQVIYNCFHRVGEQGVISSLVLLTLPAGMAANEAEQEQELMEKAADQTLPLSAITTGYSLRQYMVLLPGTDPEHAEALCKELLSQYTSIGGSVYLQMQIHEVGAK